MNVQLPRPAPASLALRPLEPPFRPVLWIMAFIAPSFFSALSWLGNGIPALTDVSFLMLTCLCVSYLVVELRAVHRTFCFGGVMLMGGTLVWFCYDYLVNWLGIDYDVSTPFPPDVVAKAAFYHCLFIPCMLIGLYIGGARWLENVILKVPSPSRDLYMVLITITFAVGTIPFFFFSRLPWYETMWRAMTNMRATSLRDMWMFDRDGTVTLNWSGYVPVLFQIGDVGGLFAVFYAIIIRGGGITKPISWFVWAFWVAVGYGTGTRGAIIYMVLPVALLYLVRREMLDERTARRTSLWRSMAPLGLLFFIALVLVQAQAFWRSTTVEQRDISNVSLTKLQGNTMFSEGLFAWQLVPDHHEYFANTFPGEGILRAIPDTILNFFIGPIPRALWPEKPVDEVVVWLSKMGNEDRVAFQQGFTVTPGLVTYWYIRFGPGGVIEGALLFGWLTGVVEKALTRSRRHPMGMMLGLSLLTWLFRNFRDFTFINLYPLMIGSAFIYLCVRFFELAPAQLTEK